MDELDQRLNGKCAAEDRKEWGISEQERIDALEEAMRDAS